MRSLTTVAAHDRLGIHEQVEHLCNDEKLVFGIRNTEEATSSNIRRLRNGEKVVLAVPFAEEDPAYEAFGDTELAGSAIAPDFGPHRDSRPDNVLNVHHVVWGSVLAKFAVLPDDLHDSNLELIRSFDEIGDEFSVQTVKAERGDTLCFLGGRATHEFTSLTDQRFSIIRSFLIKPE